MRASVPWDVRGEVPARRGDPSPDDLLDRHLQKRRGVLTRIRDGDPVWLDANEDSDGVRTLSLTRPARDSDPEVAGRRDERQICLELDWRARHATLQHLRSAD